MSCGLTDFDDLCDGSGMQSRLQLPTSSHDGSSRTSFASIHEGKPLNNELCNSEGVLSNSSTDDMLEAAKPAPGDPLSKQSTEDVIAGRQPSLCYECRGAFGPFKKPYQCAMCQQMFCTECAAQDLAESANGKACVCHYCKIKSTVRPTIQQSDSLGLMLAQNPEAEASFCSEGLDAEDEDHAPGARLSPSTEEGYMLRKLTGSITAPLLSGQDASSPEMSDTASQASAQDSVDSDASDAWDQVPMTPRQLSAVESCRDWPAPGTDAEALSNLLALARQHLRRLIDGLLRQLHTVPEYSPSADPDANADLTLSDIDGWTEIIAKLAWDAARKVKLNPAVSCGMDLRQLVKVKAVEGGDKSECEYIDGILFRKNVAIRKMPTELLSPRLLVLRGCVEHERTSSITTFDVSIDQHDAALERVFDSIQALAPSIVLVEKSVNEYVRRRMAEHNMALAINVKHSILSMVARCTAAQVVANVNMLQAPPPVKGSPTPPPIGPSPIGTCSSFSTRRIGDQTFMCLKGCLESQGCTLLLRGASSPVLKRLKNLMSFAVFAAHSLNAEAHYYSDSYTTMPPRPFIPFNKTLPVQQLDEDPKPSTAIKVPDPPEKEETASPTVSSSGLSSGQSPPAKPPTELPKIKTVCFTDTSPQAIDPVHHGPPEGTDEFPLDLLSISMDVEFMPAPGEVRRSFFSSESDTDYKVSFNDAYHQPLRHQSIAVLHSVVYQNADAQVEVAPTKSPNAEDAPETHDHVETDFTVESSLLLLRYYDCSTNDLTLGQFIHAVLSDERILLRERTSTQYLVCQRQYAHHQGRLLITLERSAENFGDTPVTWSYCKVCKACASPRKPLSDEALLFSFGKWLEVSFYNRTAKSRSCGHALHGCMTRYYGIQHGLITVSYVGISVYDIVPPAAVLTYDATISARFMEEEWQEVRCATEEGFYIVRQMLDNQGQQLPPSHSYLYDVKKAILVEQQEKAMAELHSLHGSGNIMQLNDFRLQLYKIIVQWDEHLTELVNYDNEQAAEATSPVSPMFKHHRTSDGNIVGSHCEISLSRSDDDLTELPPRNDSEYSRDDTMLSTSTTMTRDDMSVSTDESAFIRGATSTDNVKEFYSVEVTPADATKSPPSSPCGQPSPQNSSASPRLDSKPWTLPAIDTLTRLAPHECVSPRESPTTASSHASTSLALVDHDAGRKKSVSKPGAKKGPMVPAPLTLCNQRTQLGLKQPSNGRVVIVRDDEPSSIIAYTLCSEEYEAVNPFGALQTNSAEDPSASRNATRNALSLLYSKDKLHVEFKWAADAGTRGEGSRSQLAVTVYFATQFAALRRLYCAGDDLPVIQSMARCMPFKPTGGKSRASFIKTADDRFVLKRISAIERKHMLSTARKYFEHMYKVYHRDRLKRLRSTLVKILGFFKVSVTKPASGFGYAREAVHYYVLMENLIYGHEGVKVIYDLKGSRRNRYQNEKGAVQLDENLIEMLQSEEGTGLFVKESSKERLNICIHNDTVMLSKINVMDYSLLVAVDEEKGQLLVGIIDYIRQYTLDKQVEYVVKSSRVMGGKGKQPTVVPTQDYKHRFRQAMQHYFSVVPTKASMWMMLLGNYQTLVDPTLKQELIRCTNIFQGKAERQGDTLGKPKKVS